MNNQTKNKIVSNLRFPEFQEAEEWEEKQLEKAATFLKGKGISKSDITQNGALPCIRYGELYTHYNETIKSVKSYTDLPPDDLVLSQANDVIIPASGETHEDIATASCVMESGIALGGDLNIIRTKMNGVFLSYYLNNVKKKDIAQLAQGISVVHLYSGQLKKLNISIPELKEQQKIADCLTSIDEFIIAQNQKLDALKAHKKGLMQQLIPAEGETVPMLRFPEFQDAGVWKAKSLGSICDYWNGASHEGAVIENGNYYLISLNSIDIDGNLKSVMKRLSHTDNSLHKNDLIMVLSDVAHGNFLGLTDIIPDNKFVLNQRMAGLRVKDSNIASVSFLRTFINYNQKYFKQKGQGSSQLNLSKSSVTDFPLLLPKPLEQQKIADCLSSIDELINAQSQKLDALKSHKKGLMQQLFPTSNELNT